MEQGDGPGLGGDGRQLRSGPGGPEARIRRLHMPRAHEADGAIWRTLLPAMRPDPRRVRGVRGNGAAGRGRSDWAAHASRTSGSPAFDDRGASGRSSPGGRAREHDAPACLRNHPPAAAPLALPHPPGSRWAHAWHEAAAGEARPHHGQHGTATPLDCEMLRARRSCARCRTRPERRSGSPGPRDASALPAREPQPGQDAAIADITPLDPWIDPPWRRLRLAMRTRTAASAAHQATLARAP